MELRRLSLADEAAFRKAHESFDHSERFTFVTGLTPERPFRDFLAELARKEDPRQETAERVAALFLAAFVDGEVVGRVSIRPRLNAKLLEMGGHIGYGVVPAFRRRGLGTLMLVDSLSIARDWGLERVLLTCDDDNEGSRRIIEACGGCFERFAADDGAGVKKRRYWIDL